MTVTSFAGTAFEIVAEGVGFTEGPTAVPGGVAFVSDSLACVFLVVDGPSVRRIDTGGGPNGMARDADGSLFVAQNGGAWFGQEGETGVQKVRPDGSVSFIVSGFSAPNDICIGPDGRLYFTDPTPSVDIYDAEKVDPGRVFSCRRDGSDLRLVHDGLLFVNGLAFDADGTTIYLAETATRRIHAATWSDGEIGDLRVLVEFDNGAPDGFALDRDGNLWVPLQRDHAVVVVSPTGVILDALDLPDGAWPTNCCFGGDDMRTLYVTTSRFGAVVRSRVEAEGLPLRTTA